jgi:hypothetical protein
MKIDAMGMFLLNFDSNTEQVKMRMRTKFHQITRSEFTGAFRSLANASKRDSDLFYGPICFKNKFKSQSFIALAANKWELSKIN